METPQDTGPQPAPPPERRGCGWVALGALLVLVGIPLLPCPGPGIAVIGAGAGMVAAGLGLSRKDEP